MASVGGKGGSCTWRAHAGSSSYPSPLTLCPFARFHSPTFCSISLLLTDRNSPELLSVCSKRRGVLRMAGTTMTVKMTNTINESVFEPTFPSLPYGGEMLLYGCYYNATTCRAHLTSYVHCRPDRKNNSPPKVFTSASTPGVCFHLSVWLRGEGD